MTEAQTVVNAVRTSCVDVSDRGLQYGDGVFRTLLVRGEFWLDAKSQLAKLDSDAQALGIGSPAVEQWLSDYAQLSPTGDWQVLKCILTRGPGGRGYAIPPGEVPATRIMTLSETPRYPAEYRDEGVELMLCEQRWGHQPRLAGIKHLNRLEQVLARSEVAPTGAAQEGLMLDINERVISGCMTNIFAVKDAVLVTPLLDHCGVAGVIRQRLLNLADLLNIRTSIRSFDLDFLRHADEVFLCNSLIGIWPVRRLQQTHWRVGEVCRMLQEKLAHPRLFA